MTLSIGQTTWNLFPDNAEPGQPADCTYNEIGSFTASSVINPGCVCIVDSTGLQAQQLTVASGTDTYPAGTLGIAALRSARESSGSYGVNAYGIGGLAYQVGETVPVLLRGRIYASWAGDGAQPVFAAPAGIYASSTNTALQGVFTSKSAQTTAGSEIVTCPNVFRGRQAEANTSPYILLDVNIPGSV